MKSREERRVELRQLMNSPRKAEVDKLFLNCFPPGAMPPVGVLMIETILDHEYPPQPVK